MLGTEKLTNAVLTVIRVGEAVDQSLADDGKISVWEGTMIAFKAIGFIRVIKDAPEIWAEYKDLDDAEKAELTELVAEELDLTDEDLEEKIEQIFLLLLNLNEIIGSLK